MSLNSIFRLCTPLIFLSIFEFIKTAAGSRIEPNESNILIQIYRLIFAFRCKHTYCHHGFCTKLISAYFLRQPYLLVTFCVQKYAFRLHSESQNESNLLTIMVRPDPYQLAALIYKPWPLLVMEIQLLFKQDKLETCAHRPSSIRYTTQVKLHTKF